MSDYKKCGVYMILNKTNGMTYIGKTLNNFGDRWDSHKSSLRKGYHYNEKLQHDWAIYGESNFEFCILEETCNNEVANGFEIKYIYKYRANNLCYNIADGGDIGVNSGKKISDAAKNKIGEKNRKNMTGKKFSEKTKRKMSESQHKRYDNWSEADRIAHGEMTSRCAKGYKWSDESKKNFSNKQKYAPNGAKFTSEDILNIRQKRLDGYKLSELAKEYSTSESYISSIVHRRRWANI